jgi:hypothetical protein
MLPRILLGFANDLKKQFSGQFAELNLSSRGRIILPGENRFD